MNIGIAIPATLSALAAMLYFTLAGSDLPPALLIVSKGAAVAILAIAAALGARGRDGWLLAMMMALGAAGDMLLEIDMMAGAAAFAAGHVCAIVLYLGNLRTAVMPFSQKAAAAALLLAALPLYLLSGERGEAGIAVYATLLCGMAVSAWLSRFSRYRTGIGAVLFVISDALVFARLGGTLAPALAALIWPLYAAGQLLIFIGVRETLARD